MSLYIFMFIFVCLYVICLYICIYIFMLCYIFMSEFGRVCERRKLRVNVGKSKVMRCSRYGNGTECM